MKKNVQAIIPPGFIAVLQTASSGDAFAAHFALQGIDLTQRCNWNAGFEAIPELDAAVVKLCQLGDESSDLLFRCLMVVPGAFRILSQDPMAIFLQALMERDFSESAADSLIHCVNTIVADSAVDRRFLPLHLTKLVCLARGFQRDGGLEVDLQQFALCVDERAGGDFISSISHIVLPVILLIEAGQRDEKAVQRIESRLTGPLYRICEALATSEGVVSRAKFFDNMAWFVTHRLEGLPDGCETMSLCRPREVAQLVCKFLNRPVKSYLRHLRVSDNTKTLERLQKCRVVLDYVKEHLDQDERQPGLTHLFSGLLAQYGHLLHYGRHECYEALVDVLHRVFADVNVDQCQNLLKRRHGVYLSIYLREFDPSSLQALSETNLTGLMEHDLGL